MLWQSQALVGRPRGAPSWGASPHPGVGGAALAKLTPRGGDMAQELVGARKRGHAVQRHQLPRRAAPHDFRHRQRRICHLLHLRARTVECPHRNEMLVYWNLVSMELMCSTQTLVELPRLLPNVSALGLRA